MTDPKFTEVPVEPHIIEMFVTLDAPIDIPGCMGLMPVFLNRGYAEKYAMLAGYSGYKITPWRTDHE